MACGEMSHGKQTIAAVPEPCICTTHFWAEEGPKSCQPDGGYWSRSINTPVQPSVSAARVGGQVLAGEQPGCEADFKGVMLVPERDSCPNSTPKFLAILPGLLSSFSCASVSPCIGVQQADKH